MASSYTNITVKGPEQADIIAHLRTLGRRAYVSPTTVGCTVVFDEASEGQDTELLGSLAESLSGHFGCPAVAIIDHEDAVLMYQLYVNGEIIDEYLSVPEAFEMDEEDAMAVAGDERLICEAFGRHGYESKLREVLDNQTKYSAEYERHKDITDLLGLPRIAVNLGFMYIAGSRMPERIETAGLLLTD